MEVGSRCPICGKRPEIDPIKFPLGTLKIPCSCLLDKNISVVIETWEYAVIAQKRKNRKDGAKTMQVTYNGFTGELIELKRKKNIVTNYNTGISSEGYSKDYDLSIYDSEKRVTHSFIGVKMEDVKFNCGTVSFGK